MSATFGDADPVEQLEACIRSGGALSVDLKFAERQDAKLRRVFRLLSRAAAPTSLDLWGSVLQPDTVTALHNLLHESSSLSTLDIGAIELGDQNCTALLSTIIAGRTLASIRVLNLGKNHLTEACAPSIAQLIRSSSTLERLDLKRNDLTNAAATEIAQALPGNMVLRELSLVHNHIGTKGGADLLQALQSNKHLAVADLSFNLVGKSVLRGIKACCDANKQHRKLAETALGPVHVPVQETVGTALEAIMLEASTLEAARTDLMDSGPVPASIKTFGSSRPAERQQSPLYNVANPSPDTTVRSLESEWVSRAVSSTAESTTGPEQQLLFEQQVEQQRIQIEDQKQLVSQQLQLQLQQRLQHRPLLSPQLPPAPPQEQNSARFDQQQLFEQQLESKRRQIQDQKRLLEQQQQQQQQQLRVQQQSTHPIDGQMEAQRARMMQKIMEERELVVAQEWSKIKLEQQRTTDATAGLSGKHAALEAKHAILDGREAAVTQQLLAMQQEQQSMAQAVKQERENAAHAAMELSQQYSALQSKEQEVAQFAASVEQMQQQVAAGRVRNEASKEELRGQIAGLHEQLEVAQRSFSEREAEKQREHAQTFESMRASMRGELSGKDAQVETLQRELASAVDMHDQAEKLVEAAANQNMTLQTKLKRVVDGGQVSPVELEREKKECGAAVNVRPIEHLRPLSLCACM